MYKNINDYEQLYLIRENDEDAKRIVFEKYTPIIFSIAGKYKLKKEQIDFEDLVQEGYIGLNQAINSFDESNNNLFYTFSIICIERQMKTAIRKYNRKKNYSMNNSVSLDEELEKGSIYKYIVDTTAKSNPMKCVELSSYYRNLINFKNSLAFPISSVFELRINGFKYKEISKLLDISLSSVDSYVHTIKMRLKNYISCL